MNEFSRFGVLAVLLVLATSKPLENDPVHEVVQTTEKRLIKTSEQDLGQWLTESQILKLNSLGIGFIDITDQKESSHSHKKAPNSGEIPQTPRFTAQVQDVIAQIDLTRAVTFLTSLTSFFNRYYTSQSGLDAALFIKSQAEASVVESGYPGAVTVNTFEHASYIQPSVIVRIEGADSALTQQRVILGSHLDSATSGANGEAPGADDDGSGSTIVLEVLRSILHANFIPKRTIEFQWYAAEEVGLRGSGEIASSYSEAGVDVFSMLNFDVDGYYTEERIGLNTDYIDVDLTEFLRTLVQTYTQWGWKDRTCGYGCSDHASFYYENYRVAYAKEPNNSPYWHTRQDTLDTVNFTQLHEYMKLGIAYAIETSEPSNE